MLQKESLDKTVLDLIYALEEKEYLKDLFTTMDFNAETLLEKLESDVDFSMDFIEKNTIKGYADGIKVDLLAHKYPLINKTLELEELRIASMDDISAMKLNSVANDGTRIKDFIDLYFLISQHDYNVEKLLKNYEAKYTQRNAMYALKSLNYFDDVNIADWPELLKNKEISWKEMKNTIDKACKDYIKMIT